MLGLVHVCDTNVRRNWCEQEFPRRNLARMACVFAFARASRASIADANGKPENASKLI